MISNEVLLLKIIDSKSSISLLRDKGLSHSQIAMLIKDQQEKGRVIISEDEIVLSHQGKKYLSENLSEYTVKEKDQWILPQEHFYKTPIDFKKIVLPKKRKI